MEPRKECEVVSARLTNLELKYSCATPCYKLFLHVINCFFLFNQQLFYTEEQETLFFYNLPPGEDVVVNTYTSHRWFAKDLDTDHTLHVNGRKEYIPEETDSNHPIRVFVTVPSL